MQTAGFTISNQVYIPDRLKPDCHFEQRYIDLRCKEKRIYSDEELFLLPETRPDHPHHNEWQVRKRSAGRLLQYFRDKGTPKRILEVGCGNGWLSRQMASVPGMTVIGTDINFTELQQAARVFSEIPNLLFIYADIESEILEEMEFDCIVLASCIQYFESLETLVKQSIRLLKPGGEIHIMDSPFYKPSEKTWAEKRTEAYFTAMGFPEMSRHYFHHSVEAINGFYPEWLFRPSPLQKYFTRYPNPFPWIRIKHTALIA